MRDFFDHIKENKVYFGIVIGCVVMFVAVIVSLSQQYIEKTKLEDKQLTLSNRLSDLQEKTSEKEAALAAKKAKVIYKTTGLDASYIAVDEKAAESFFEDAFNWRSSDEYNKARAKYMKELGRDNSFTKTYLPPDTVIDTNDGKLSFIDFKSLKAHLGKIEVVPLTADKNTIHYVAFVRYYMYKNEGDLNNLDALAASDAVIKFTASGNKNDRKISDVQAWAGFSSSFLDN